MIRMRISGAKDAVLRLRNIDERVRENARKTMHRAADRIVKNAKAYAPVDEHNLEEAIEKRVTYESPRRRLAIDVGLKDMVNGVDVSVYGVVMHEGEYNLGPKSEEKQNSTGKKVGPGFITRAYQEEEDKLLPQMVAAVDEEIDG